MLTESEVQRSFRKLVTSDDAEPDQLDRAEELLDHLRPESPLRHRLYEELEELRQLRAVQS